MGALKIDTTFLSTLLEQLSHFGLNPREWHLFGQNEDILQFSHREDPNFKINATLRALHTGAIRLDRLSVVSI